MQWPLPATAWSRDASSMTRAPRKSRNSESPRLPFTLVCRCFCSAFRELIWSQHRPRTSAYVPRCAGTTARTCAPGNPPFEQARRRKPQVDRNPPRASDRLTTCVASPLREISLARESSRRAPARYPQDPHACAYGPGASKRRGDRESRFFRRFTPVLSGVGGLLLHGSNWLKRFLATSSVPVSPESVASPQMVCAR